MLCGKELINQKGLGPFKISTEYQNIKISKFRNNIRKTQIKNVQMRMTDSEMRTERVNDPMTQEIKKGRNSELKYMVWKPFVM